jgi:diadenosine tetraphosphate (Ap4A) HIT family hydrolase
MPRNRAIWTRFRRAGTGLRSSAGRAVQARFKPVKLNYMTPGNTVPHVHAHVLPRYQDDSAPGGPVAWEAIFALIRYRRLSCTARPQISAAWRIPDLDG